MGEKTGLSGIRHQGLGQIHSGSYVIGAWIHGNNTGLVKGYFCSSPGILTNQKEDSGQVPSLPDLYFIHLQNKRFLVSCRHLQNHLSWLKKCKFLGATPTLSEYKSWTFNKCPSDTYWRIIGSEALCVLFQCRCSMILSLGVLNSSCMT